MDQTQFNIISFIWYHLENKINIMGEAKTVLKDVHFQVQLSKLQSFFYNLVGVWPLECYLTSLFFSVPFSKKWKVVST